MDTTLCPECGALAEVQWRAVMESTDGPVEHAKIGCVRGRSGSCSPSPASSVPCRWRPSAGCRPRAVSGRDAARPPFRPA